ncbi:4Fe-4S dicluster domain-containing protein [Shewanella sp. WXL01]|uniref:4Fe-4S dicluster domain-containing protein n=1 Tax=Shewanella maritima TaxID=2520507 RepID=A0A411PIP9_9GAMM|nr:MULTISPECIES: 4Fe-4S dicluster domain-containing protein [Shewanella]NKF52739.1 4Fe-4S dicluster domain-containing protein [Shewanella sp. WXL01]QBF83378.1 4Fe-4S dicluster domain-containing protein [Shewanella maritima]
MLSDSTQHGFYFDTRKCIGCKKCHRVCKAKFDSEHSVNPRRVYKSDGDVIYKNRHQQVHCNVPTFFMSLACNHCSEPVCVLACPSGAMHKRSEDGLVHVIQDMCTGCGACARACPYDAPQLDPVKKVIVKCDGCFEQVQHGDRPLCVAACPKQALDFGTIEQLKLKHGQKAHISSIPSSQITSPNTLLGGLEPRRSANRRKGNMGKKYPASDYAKGLLTSPK